MKNNLKYIITFLLFISMIITGCFSVDTGPPDGFGDDDEDDIPANCACTSGIVYVHISSGNDDNEGTITSPKRSLQSGINCAASLSEASRVNVTQGTTNIDGSMRSLTSPPAGIIIKNGVSVYGGYSSSSWSTRDPSIYVTRITDTSTSGGNVGSPNRALHVEANVSSSTVLDGVTVQGGNGEYSAGIAVMGGDVTIQNCTVTGGNDGSWSYGIFLDDNSAPLITDNTITGGSSGATYSAGIRVRFAAPEIKNNTINGGSGSSASIGIDEYYADSIIEDNIINGGTSSGAVDGISVTGSVSVIKDNTINALGTSPSKSTGISLDTYQSSSGINYEPVLQNNTIYVGNGSLAVLGINISNASPVLTGNSLICSGGTTFNSWGIYLLPGAPDPKSISGNTFSGFSSGNYNGD